MVLYGMQDISITEAQKVHQHQWSITHYMYITYEHKRRRHIKVIPENFL